MAVEYGLITGEMKEKDVMAAISKLLEDFFRGKKENVSYDVYKYHKLMKHKNSHGISFHPDRIEWDYEYKYDYSNKPYRVFIEIYPNVNAEGAQKFKIEGVTWNMYFNDVFLGERPADDYVHQAIRYLLPFLLEGMPCETVLIKEYARGEERL